MTEFNFDQLLSKLKGREHRVVVFAPQNHYSKVVQFCQQNEIEYLGIDRHVNKEAISIRLDDTPNHWLLYEYKSYADDDRSRLMEAFGNDFTDAIFVYWDCDNPVPQMLGRSIRTRSHREQWVPKRLENAYMIGLKVTADS